MSARYGLTRRERLSRGGTIRDIQSNAPSVSGSLLTVFYRKVSGDARTRCESRFGVVVTRRTASQATVRNRLKRWVREYVRCNKARLRGAQEVLIRFRPFDSGRGLWPWALAQGRPEQAKRIEGRQKPPEGIRFQLIASELEKLFRQAGLFDLKKST